MKYSKVYVRKYGKHTNRFRYNYDEQVLECVYKPDAEDLERIRNKASNSAIEWMREDAERSIKTYEETGYVILTSESLSDESWKEGKEYYMDMMGENIACECGY